MADIQIEKLKRLPRQDSETWQGGFIRMPAWVTGETDQPIRPWATFWLAVQPNKISPPELCRPDEKNLSMGLQSLVNFAEDTELTGYCPGRIEVNDAALAEFLEPRLAEASIAVEHKPNLPAFEAAMDSLTRHMHGQPPIPSLLKDRAITLDHVRRFAEAVAAFYRAAPWQHLSDEDLIRIDQPKPPAGFKYATVLGAAGETFGLGFYHRAKDCWTLRAADFENWLEALPHGLWHFTYGDITEMPLADADLWEDHALPVADEQGYPCLFGYTANSGIRRPNAKQFEFIIGL